MQVKDSANITATKSLSIAVTAAALVITTSSLPNGTVAVNYSQTLNATGGTGNYQWTVTGPLPAGLSLNGAVISGNPTTAGSSTFNVQVKDSANTTVSKSLSITINAAALVITTTSLPNGTVGVAYSQILNATGGTGRYQWTVTGTL